MSDGGKGSAPRPFSVDADTFEVNWNRIFRGKLQMTDVYDEVQSWDSNSESEPRVRPAGGTYQAHERHRQ